LAWVLAAGGRINAAEPAVSGGTAAGAQVVTLRFVEDPGERRGLSSRSFDKSGRVELPLNNAAGRLLLQYRNGKLWADTNGDGTIDGKDGPPVTPERVTIRVAAKVAGKSVQYPLFIDRVHMVGASPRQLVFSPRGTLEGKFGAYTLRILDGNEMARFGNAGDDIALIPTAAPARPAVRLDWSPTIELDGSLYRIEMLGDGAQLRVTPYAGEVARVALQAPANNATASVLLVAEDGKQISALHPDHVSLLVPGKYRVSCTLHGARGASYLINQASGHKAFFDARQGENVLKVGAPFSLQFTATRTGDEVEFTAGTLLGRAGEPYRPMFAARQHEGCAAYVRVGEKEMKLCDLEFS
jgi:hypothetical protein